MNLRILILCAAVLFLGTGLEPNVIAQSQSKTDQVEQSDQVDARTPIQMFDGKTLNGWDADPKFWSVEDGAITGRTTKAVSYTHLTLPTKA